MRKKSMLKDECYDIWWLISQVDHSLLELRNRELKKYNITAWQASVLFLVKLFGKEATPTNLSHLMMRKLNTISETLNRMETQGLVKRIRDLKHRGMIRIALTEKGMEAYNYTAKRTSLNKVTGFLEEEECKVLISYLKIMRENAFIELGVNRTISFP
ncbi:MarR family winged helix-turn-helix transcriptional regulator [Chloroflexota bacterium]